MHVGRLGAVGRVLRDVAEIAVFARASDVRVAEPLRLGERLFRPGAGDQVVGRLVLGEQVHGDHEELRGGAPLKKQNLIVVRNAAHLAAEGDRLVVDVQKGLAAVGMFENADPRRAQRQQRSRASSRTGTGNTAGPEEKL